MGEIRGLESFLLALSHSSLSGKEIQVRSRHFSYPVYESKLFFFFFPLVLCWSSSYENLDFHVRTLLCGWLSMTVVPEAPGLWLRDARAGSGATAGTTVRTDICLPFTWCICGRDTSWVPWAMMSSLSHHSKAGLSVDGYPIFVVGSGAKTIRSCATMLSSEGLEFILSRVNSPALFWLPFSWNSIFYPFILSLYLPLMLVSHRQQYRWILDFYPCI